MASNMTLGYKFTLRFCDPTNFGFGDVRILIFASLMALFFAWIADNYIGKCYVTLMGLIFLAMANAILLFGEVNYITEQKNILLISSIMILLYTCTSGISNSLILEQVEQNVKISGLRLFIFLLIYVRLIIFFLWYIFLSTTKSFITKSISFILTIGYLIVYIFMVNRFYLESTYHGIWSESFKCIGITVIKLINTVNQTTKKDKVSKILILKSSKEQFYNRKRIMFNKKVMANFYNRLNESNVIIEKHCWGYNGLKAEQRIRNPGDLNTDLAERPDGPSLSVPWNNFYLALPWVSKYVIEQTRELKNISIHLLPCLLISNLIYCIMTVSTEQSLLTVTSHHWSRFTTELVHYSMILDLLLFPFYEIVIYLFLRKRNFKQVHNIKIGYVILIISLIITAINQYIYENIYQYLPSQGYTQIRFFNAHDKEMILYSEVFSKIAIKPGQFSFKPAIKCHGRRKAEIIIINDSQQMYRFVIELVEKQTISYILTNTSVVKNAEYDPRILSVRLDKWPTHLFTVSNSNLTGVNLTERSSGKHVHINIGKNKKYELPPGSYNITIGVNGAVQTLELGQMESATLYALFIYSKSNKYNANLITLEGPLRSNDILLTTQVFLVGLANAISSVSYFTFLHLQSPDKMRGGIFTIVVLLQYLGIVFAELTFIFDINRAELLFDYCVVHMVLAFIYAHLSKSK